MYLIQQVCSFWEERRMTIQARHFGSRLLLILALAAAPLAGIVAVQWAMGQRNVVHAIVTSSEPHYMAPAAGGDSGGGRHRNP
jgi:hypothetical protein